MKMIVNLQELDELEYKLIHLYVKLKASNENIEIEPFTSRFHQEKSKEKSNFLIHETLFELKAIAEIDDLLIGNRRLKDEKEIEALENLILFLLDKNDIIQVIRIQEMFGHLPEDMKLLAYMMSLCEGLSSIYDLAKEERQALFDFGTFSNKLNRLTLRTLKREKRDSIMGEH
jgi:hypothetical protein